MRPRIVEFFIERLGTGFFVPDYAVMLSLAIVLGVYLCMLQAERVGLETGKAFRVSIAAILAALVSARLYVVIQHWDYYRLNFSEVFSPWGGGLASYGAYLGGTLGLLLAARYEGLPTARFLDACAPYMALAVVFGRVGCFLNGCCHGHVSDAAWAVRFPADSDAQLQHLSSGWVETNQMSLPVHPTQLYEAAFALALFFLMLVWRKRVRHEGALFALFFLLYPLARFFNEFLRGDERGTLFALSLPQVLSLTVLAVAACALASMRREAHAAVVVVVPTV